MPRLYNMAVRTLAKHFLALFLLLSVCAPYVHAAVEMGEHEECSMEMCKRTGKCCCRQNNVGKPHWSAQDACHPGATWLPGTSASPVAMLSISTALIGLTPVAADPVAPSVVIVPAALLARVGYQRPPPRSF